MNQRIDPRIIDQALKALENGRSMEEVLNTFGTKRNIDIKQLKTALKSGEQRTLSGYFAKESMSEEQKAVTNFIGKIANKDYSEAQTALQDAVAEKLKNKIRSYITQEN